MILAWSLSTFINVISVSTQHMKSHILHLFSSPLAPYPIYLPVHTYNFSPTCSLFLSSKMYHHPKFTILISCLMPAAFNFALGSIFVEARSALWDTMLTKYKPENLLHYASTHLTPLFLPQIPIIICWLAY
jgi:hypothetical protein